MAAPQLSGRCLIFVLLAASLLSAQGSLQWKDCDTSTIGSVSVKNISMLPDPAVSGKDFSLTVQATTDAALNGVKVTVKVYFLGFQVHTEEDDLCKMTPCPAGPGDFSLTNKQRLPWISPAGSYKVQLTLSDASGGALFCEDIQFNIVRPKGPMVGELADLLERQVDGASGAVRVMADAWDSAAARLKSWAGHLRAAAADRFQQRSEE